MTARSRASLTSAVADNPTRLGSPRLSNALALCAAFVLASAVYWPALRGPFISDDLHYVRENPYVKDPSFANIIAIANPRGDASAMVENWSPVHLWLHAAAWRAFGDDVVGHHLLNLALHALASLLLARLLARSGLPPTAAMFGGALFLLHPANVEAVAWISQLKSVSALALAFSALLLIERRPAIATGMFSLALLAKPTAAFALPFAALSAWTRRLDRPAPRAAIARWLVVWAIAFCAFAFIELALFHRSGQDIRPPDPDVFVRVRSVVANAFGYLVMTATTHGLSTFHEPAAARSLVDLRWLGGLVALLALSVRALLQLRRGHEEAVWWIFAAVSFVPVSQIFPFLYPVADRYLYFILPGLIGGTLLALTSLRDPWMRFLIARGVGDANLIRTSLSRLAFVLGFALCVFFAARSHERSRVWSNPALVFADSARHYPDGMAANLLRARRAAGVGDAKEAAASLRRAFDRGFLYFEQIGSDPVFATIRETADMRAVLDDMAGWWIERIDRLDRPTQAELALLGRAYLYRGERAEALGALERAAAQGGPMDAAIRAQLHELHTTGSRGAIMIP